MPMKALVVEDIAEVREALVDLIRSSCPQVEVVGSAESVVQAAKLIRAEAPDLLFLDIQLSDGSGFDLLDITGFDNQVIFTTASEEHALKAFRYAAIDYLLKPVEPGALEEAVSRAGDREHTGEAQMDILRATMGDKRPDRIALSTSDRLHIIALEDIIRCHADGNYTEFSIQGHKPILVARTLKDYDNLLSPQGFLRVHQSHLVNIGWVREFVKTDGGYLVMLDGTKVPVSTRKRQEVLQRLNDVFS
jgi:two-component system LytT family response regulator